MITRPKFKDCYHVEVIEPQTIFLVTEDRHWALTGRVYTLLAPLLTGQYTVSELIDTLSGKVSAPELIYTLNRLEEKGYIVDADDRFAPEHASFWQLLGVDTALVHDRLTSTPVAVQAVGNVAVEPLQATLAELGVQFGGDALVQVVVTDNYLHPELATINATALAKGQPWVLVRPLGNMLWIGPLFQPEQTGCWACLAHRLEGNRQLEGFILRKTGQPGPLALPLADTPTTTTMAAHLAALEIVKWIVRQENPQISGQIMTLDLRSLEMQSHVLTRRPQCPACGQPERYREVQPVQLTSRKKLHTGDGGHRIALPETTFARYKHHISPITGVISWLTDLTAGNANGLVFCYGAGHNFAMIRDDLYWLQRTLRSNTGGKGMTEIQAKVSAMGEAIERYSGVYRGDEPTIRASYRSLGAQAVHLHDCLLFSEAQYANRHGWNRHGNVGRFHVVPDPFDEEQELDWSPVWSLTNEHFKYLPSCYCYFGHPDTTRFRFCFSDGNGNSAGNTMEEAILQGFLELVERDCTALWWYNRVRRPGVDLASFQLPYLDALQYHYREIGREFWVIDISTDLGIPTFAAISRRVDHPVEDILLGLGAHLDPQVALLRAITELNQFLPAVARRTPDGNTIYSFPDGEAVEWWKNATLAAHPYLSPDPQLAPRRAADYRNLASDDLLTDVQTCVAIAKETDLEVLVQDQTRPDIGMPVCRVVVPGLRHFWRRLGPGRLYTVPVKLGWQLEPTPEDQMNSYSIFF